MSGDTFTIAEARRRLGTLRQSLPVSVDPRMFMVQEKAPILLLSIREALAWRTEELGRNACDMLDRGDNAGGIILTRTVVESAVFIWRLQEILENRARYTPDKMQDFIEKMGVGWKGEPDFPEAINILTMLGKVEKTLPGIEKRYKYLSEFAHPNWSGVSGLFSEIDFESHIIHFGRDFERSKGPRYSAIIMLIAALDIFEHCYNKISDEMPKYVKELTPF